MVGAERLRLDEADTGGVPWRRWGPYLSARQWGTVREDYGNGDDTWSYFSREKARSRAYRWGDDGQAGVSDDRQRLCLALGLWNGRDPIRKERLFGLTNAEGNHGEDVKECYFHLDATPTSSYRKMLYKYPQAEFPYADLIAVNAARGKSDPEYELLGTGIGASHQTGWTGTARLLPLLSRGISAEGLGTGGRGAIKSAAAGLWAGAAR